MTTTITIETHSWPVAVTTSDSFHHTDNVVQSHGYRDTTTFVPKETKRLFHISSNCSLSVRELHADATGLSDEKVEGGSLPDAPADTPVAG
ncbi:hypothetical protein MRBLMC3_000797 [Sphingobium sp. LMC3-1-1.1]|uniref:hypothetical protein n=1 Tax=Sphingobium sp. LMC3-1-1.1 TaxID=3135241 RepID=UPI003420C341